MAALPILLVFGATGATGSEVVKQALAAGNLQVRVFVRNPSKLPKEVTANERLEVFEGDFTDADKVDAACEGVKYSTSLHFQLFSCSQCCFFLLTCATFPYLTATQLSHALVIRMRQRRGPLWCRSVRRC